MSLLLPFVAAAGATYYGAKAHAMMRRARDTKADHATGQRAFHGPVQHVSKMALSPERLAGRFRSARKGYDERGAPCYFVDYGDFAETIIYENPYEQRH